MTTEDKSTPRPWTMVPVNPTPEMLEAGANWTDYQPEDKDGLAPNADMHCAKRVYQAMLSVAPRQRPETVNQHSALKACAEALREIAVPTGTLDTHDGALAVIAKLQKAALSALAALDKAKGEGE